MPPLQTFIVPAAAQLDAPGHPGTAQQPRIRETDEADAAQTPALRPEQTSSGKLRPGDGLFHDTAGCLQNGVHSGQQATSAAL